MNVMDAVMRARGPVLGFILVLACAGCQTRPKGPQPRAFEVEVLRDSSLASSRVLVDLAGVSELNKGTWDSTSLADYWNSQFRGSHASFIHKMEFAVHGETAKVLSETDPIWQEWKKTGAQMLYVSAELPDTKSRTTIPLDRALWLDSTTTIRIRVTPAGLVVETAMAAGAE